MDIFIDYCYHSNDLAFINAKCTFKVSIFFDDQLWLQWKINEFKNANNISINSLALFNIIIFGGTLSES